MEERGKRGEGSGRRVRVVVLQMSPYMVFHGNMAYIST